MLKKDCSMEEVMEKLQAPFSSRDIEWRVSRSGISNGKSWAMVLAYVDSRAIQNRLDEVFGPAGWQNEFTDFRGGVLCTISCFIDGEWVKKTDGAEPTKFESFKGGLSGAIKRAGALWGIGRYLYNLSETYVDVTATKQTGANYINDEKSKVKGFWMPPKLPDWALPGNEKGKSATTSTRPQNHSSNGQPNQTKPQKNGNQGTQSSKETGKSNDKKQSSNNPNEFNRKKTLDDIGGFLKSTGLLEKQEWIIPLFKKVNPQIMQTSISEVGKSATEQELKMYYNVLRPVHDLTVVAKNYNVTLEDVLYYVQILVPQVKIESLFSCFTNVTKDHIVEIIQMIKEDLKSGNLKSA